MTPSRPSVRALLGKVLCADSDLDAFCSDHFQHVYSRFTNGMDRVSKVNQLLDRVPSSAILDALRRAHPDAVREHEAVLEPEPPAAARAEPPSAKDGGPTPHYPDEATRLLSMELASARARKRTLTEVGGDTAEIDREILKLRRQLREGGQLREGDALSDGRYLLIRRIGKGGFAVVWEAHDEQRRERVAIKVLHSELAGDRIRRERLFRGARIMAELSHDAIVRVLEPYAEEGGHYYFVMELLAGGDLRAAVLAGRLAGEALLQATLHVAGALAKAHGRGLVHRDVKPANILLDASGMPRLTDFDLVGGAGTTGGTRTGAIGSWIYAAPELMDRPQDADARADVYGLGMTTAFGLHGADLTMDVVRDAKGFIDRLSCNEAVKVVLKRAVEWEPRARFADASRFREALRYACAQAREKAPTIVPAATPARTPRHGVTDDEREVQTPTIDMRRAQQLTASARACYLEAQTLAMEAQALAMATRRAGPPHNAESTPAEGSKGPSPVTTMSRPGDPREPAASPTHKKPTGRQFTVDARGFLGENSVIWTFSFDTHRHIYNFLAMVWRMLREAGADIPPMTYGQTWTLFDPRAKLTIKGGTIREGLSLWDAGIRPGMELLVLRGPGQATNRGTRE